MSTEQLRRVNRKMPCPICDHTDWCSTTADGVLGFCMRVSAGSVSKAKNGAYVHRLRDDVTRHVGAKKVAPVFRKSSNATEAQGPEVATDRRHRIYAALLDGLILTRAHSDHLLYERRLSDVSIVRAQYASVPSINKAKEICRELSQQFDLTGIPGFYQANDGSWQLNASSGIFIPYRNVNREICGMQFRLDCRQDGKRYFWLSSKDRRSGAGSQSVLHFSRPWRVQETGMMLVTEGGLKGDCIADQWDVSVVAAAGITNFGADFPEKLLRSFSSLKAVAIAIDMDYATNVAVRDALRRLVDGLRRTQLKIVFMKWKDAKGFDDYLLLSQEASNG